MEQLNHMMHLQDVGGSMPPRIYGAGFAVGHASPCVRRSARERGIALESVRGSGPQGRITMQDVDAHARARSVAP